MVLADQRAVLWIENMHLNDLVKILRKQKSSGVRKLFETKK